MMNENGLPSPKFLRHDDHNQRRLLVLNVVFVFLLPVVLSYIVTRALVTWPGELSSVLR